MPNCTFLSSLAMPWWLKIPSDTLWCPMAPSDGLVPKGARSKVPPGAPRCPPLVSIGEALCQPGVRLTLRPCLYLRVSKSLEIPSAITTFYTLHPTPASCHVVERALALRLLERARIALSTFRTLSSILPLFAVWPACCYLPNGFTHLTPVYSIYLH